MNWYFKTLFSPVNRYITIGLLITGFIFVMIANSIGIADNVPGIAMLFIGLILLMLAFMHFWRKPKSFLVLLVVSLVGGLVFAVLHNLMDGLASRWQDISILSALATQVSVASFVIAVLISPVGILLGFFGAVITYFLKQNPKKTAD